MSLRTPLCAVLLLGMLQSSCSWSLTPWRRREHRGKPKVQSTFVPQPVAVGSVTLVNEEGRFVLVDNGTLPFPPTGSTLKCYPPGSESPTAELVATEVRKRPFTIADIRTGEPHKGDRVIYMPPLPKPATVAGAAPEETTKRE